MGHKLVSLKVPITLPRRTRLLCGDVVHCMSNTGLRLLERAVQCGICTEPVAAAARHLQTTSDQPTQQRVSNQPVSKLRV